MSRADRIVLSAAGAALILALAAAFVLFVPDEEAQAGVAEVGDILGGSPTPVPVSSAAAPAAPIVVDLQGAVAQPGIRELPAGARTADAIAAAGGYAPDVDLAAAAAAINLARALADGEQIIVPRVGDEATALPPSSGTAEGSAGGPAGAAAALVDLNTATQEQLESLPGIGPVTAQKIMAARDEQPFSSLDDALQRGIIHRGQLEDIQGLATAG